MKVTKRNRNCTLIGRPGTGKSRYWLIPNILKLQWTEINYTVNIEP